MTRTAIFGALLILGSPAAADQPATTLKPEPVSPRLVRTLVHPNPNSPIWFLRYSPDGRRLAAAGYPSGILQIWDPVSGKELAQVSRPPGARITEQFGALTADWQTAFTPHEGRTVVQLNGGVGLRTFFHYDGAVLVWDVATGKQRPSIKLAPGRGASEVVASPDGTKIVTLETRSHEQTEEQSSPDVVVYRDLARYGPPIDLADGFGMAAFAPDGKVFVLTTGIRNAGQSRIRLFDSLTGKETTLLAEEPRANIFYPAFSPDGKRVAAEVRNLEETASVFKVWDRDSGKEVAVLEPVEPSIVLFPQFSAGGRFVTATDKRGPGYVWDASTGKRVLTHRGGDNACARTVAVRPENRLAAVVERSLVNSQMLARDADPAHHPQPHVILYDLSSGKPVETLVCPPGFPAKAVFSPDGKTLAVGGSGAVHLFDVANLAGRE